jgi:hypothetical protein
VKPQRQRQKRLVGRTKSRQHEGVAYRPATFWAARGPWVLTCLGPEGRGTCAWEARANTMLDVAMLAQEHLGLTLSSGRGSGGRARQPFADHWVRWTSA